MSVASAGKRLAAKDGLSRTGRFLVRTKELKKGQETNDIILSVVFKGKVTHHAIKQDGPGEPVFINGAKSTCTTVDALITYLGQKRKELKWPVPLIEPVNK